MSLAPGSRLGPYEVVAPLGAGGMGEVYKARDSRLNRSVAIKLLSSEVASDPDRRKRFLREAQAVAALSHPHIGALHDIAEHEGTDYLVLELIEGETLASRLERGPLAVPQALEYGRQIVDALDHAHRRGIVHRDLKPQNLMITAGGIKLLDFGLARLARPAAAIIATLPTAPPSLTAEGTFLGTIPYMAPEQLEGRKVDGRADVFAFGAVLFEMIAGRRAFAGKSAASVIGAVLKDEPPPLSQVQPRAPLALDRVVRTCLAKEPEHRFHSAHDLGLALVWIAEQIETEPARTRPAGFSRRISVFAVLAVAVAALAGAVAGVALGPAGRDTIRPARFELQAAANRSLHEPVISRDGRHIVAVVLEESGESQLWLRPLDSEELRPLEGTQGASYPFWSPDSQSIAFFAQGKLKRLELAGGPPIEICEAENARGGTWNRDGVIILAPNLISPLVKVSASGGVPVPVTQLEAPATGHRWPHFLPDGDHFLYLAFAGQDTPRSTLRVDSLSRPGGTSLLEGATEGQYADGLLFFVQGDVLLAQPFDPDRRTLHGDVRSVAPPPASLHTGRFAFSVAADGTLVYRLALDEIQRAQLTWFAPDGRRLATIGDVDAYVTPRISPDQRRIAAGRLEGRTSDIWILEGPARIFSRLTTTPRRESLPVWSPDSQRLAVAADLGHGGGVELQIIPTGAAEAPGTFHTSTFTLRPVAWSGDGRILFQRIDQRDRVNLLTMAPQAGAEPLVFRADTYNYVQAAISPDGRHVAYASDLSGRFEVYVEDYPTPGNRRPVSHGGGTQPRWHPDGRVLYYLSPDHYLTAVRVNGVPPTYSEPRPLFALLMPEGNFRLQGANYDVAADGRILAAVLQEQAAEPRTATVWLGATATLRQ